MPNDPAVPGTAFFGHPRGLATLFFTEFFERFSFYGGRALLMLFLTAAIARGGLGIDTESAGAIYGLYAGALYLFCLPGGWVADRLLGQRDSVLYGGLLIAAGNFMLAIPASMSFYLGLIVVALGTGMLKPNISSMVGALYHGQPGTRRDAGFSIFYMGINLGGAIAPLVAGGIGETLGYRWGFATAGAAMLIGAIQYRLTTRAGSSAVSRSSPVRSGRLPRASSRSTRSSWLACSASSWACSPSCSSAACCCLVDSTSPTASASA